jgi:putative methyltransferase (TIGR04325 family)
VLGQQKHPHSSGGGWQLAHHEELGIERLAGRGITALEMTSVLRRILKRLTPPIIVDLYRAACPAPTWTGIYDHANLVPPGGDHAREAAWPLLARTTSREAIADANAAEEDSEHRFLGIAAAVACHANGGRLRVLDFGGGLGVGYRYLKAVLSGRVEIDYHIIELDWACVHGTRLFQDAVRFHRSLPDGLASVDIIYVCETLQYVADWKALLTRLCSYNARLILLADIYTGDFPTYATAQINIRGYRLPFWFVNLNDLIGTMNASGYGLVLSEPTYADVDQRSLPVALRLPNGRTRTLLFAPSG